MKRTWNNRIRSAVFALLISTTALGQAFTAAPEAAAATSHTVNVYPNQVVQSDFLGVGVNLIPTSLMTNNVSKGYEEAYWEMDRKRIETIKPKVARVWFQPDWMEPTKGTYTFNSVKMQAFYKYLDALKSAGTEIELNFGWKVGRDIQSWFGIPGVPADTSAPADVDAFAASASALLQELVVNRSYTNVKYLTFYNEPNGYWDFEAPGEQRAYYANIVQKVHNKLTADGRRNLVQIWGPEEWNDPTWTQYMKDNVDGAIDAFTFHVYGGGYGELSGQISARKNIAGTKPVILSEFGFPGRYDSGWDAGYANFIIKMANEGIKAGLIWQLNGVWVEDPNETTDTNGTYTLWDSLVVEKNPNLRYYEAGLLSRYIPAHSSVIAVNTGSPDLRAAAFKTASGDYTVVLETNEGTEGRNVAFNFNGVNIGKTFRKFTFNDSVVPEANAMLPAKSAEFAAGTSFADASIDSARNVIVYTTLPAQTQVQVSPANTAAAAGATAQLNANLVDGTGGIAWSVIGSGNGSITSGGSYTAPSLTEEKLIAVKAASVADPGSYGIALIRVAPQSTSTRAEIPSFSLAGGSYTGNQSIAITTATPGATIRYTTDGSTPTASSTAYAGPVTITSSTMLKAVAFKSGLAESAKKAVYYRITPPSAGPAGYEFCSQETQTCNFPGTASVAFGANGSYLYGTFSKKVGCNATAFGGDPASGTFKACYYQLQSGQIVSAPTFSPAGGTYSSAQTVTISTATAGAAIRYTTDGSTPTASSALYAGAINVAATTTLKAIAIKSGMSDSAVTTAAYTITGGAAGGPDGYTYCANEFGTCTFGGTASVAYGSNNAFVYGTFTNSAVCSTGAFGSDPAYNQPKKCYYQLQSAQTAATPTFSPAGGTYASAQSVTLSTATAGAEIRYTTDGSAPTASSALYAGAVQVSATTTLKAIARKSGMSDSAIATASYTISSGSSGGIDGYTFCANEFGTCAFTGTASVAYGANGAFVFGTFTNGAVCTTGTFGSDPAYNVAKKCYYKPGGSGQSTTLQNAGFETPATANHSYGPTTDGWTFNARAGVQKNGGAFGAAAAPEGVQTAFIQSVNGTHGEISQSVAFATGTYQISVQAAKRTNYGGDQTVNVYYDTTLIGTLSPASGAFAAYATNSFAAASGAHTIKFVGSAATGDHTAFIDAVTLTKLN